MSEKDLIEEWAYMPPTVAVMREMGAPQFILLCAMVAGYKAYRNGNDTVTRHNLDGTCTVYDNMTVLWRDLPDCINDLQCAYDMDTQYTRVSLARFCDAGGGTATITKNKKVKSITDEKHIAKALAMAIIALKYDFK